MFFHCFGNHSLRNLDPNLGRDPIFADPGVCDRKNSEMWSLGFMLTDHP